MAKAGGKLDIKLHEGQQEVLESTARFKILAAGRRYGKSECGVWWALERARRDRISGVDPAIGWYVAPTYKVARPVWRKFLRLAPKGWITKVSGTERMPDSMELGHVVIEFKTAEKPENLVAEGLRWVWIDEAAIISEQVWNESLRPALMDYGGPALFTSTPKGHNWFHKLYTRGKDPEYPTYASFGGPSFENPWLDEEELREVMRDMVPRLIKQEIFAEFLASDEGEVFTNVKEARLAAKMMFPKTGGYCDHPTFCVGVDLGFRIDFTVAFGVCREGHPTGLRRFQKPWPDTKDELVMISRQAGRPLMLVDQSGLGDPIVQDLEKTGMRVLGVQTGARKIQLIDALAIALNNLEILIPDDEDGEVMFNELISFGYEMTKAGNIRYSAPTGQHDDCLEPGTLIKTKAGYLPIEDVKVGDEVSTHRGRYRKVEKCIAKQFHGDFYEMRFSSNLPIRLSYNHPIYRASRSYDGDLKGPFVRRNWTLPGDWKKSYRGVYVSNEMSTPTDLLKESEFYKRMPHETQRWWEWELDCRAGRFLGKFLADGHARKLHKTYKYGIELAFHEDDTGIGWYEDYIRSLGIATRREKMRAKCLKLVFASKLLWHALSLCYRDKEKVTPSWAWRLGAATEDMLDGWLEGDGWHNPDRGQTIGATTSISLALAMRDVSLDFGRQTAIRRVKRHRYEVPTKTQWWVEVHDYQKKTSHVKLTELGDHVFPVRNVQKEEYQGTVYNLQVEEDRSFLANGIVVHNCVIAAALASYGLLNAPPPVKLWGL